MVDRYQTLFFLCVNLLLIIWRDSYIAIWYFGIGLYKDLRKLGIRISICNLLNRCLV